MMMIQTCPACGTRFALPDNAFAQGPRKLRCAKCQHVWRSDANGIVLPEAEPAAPPVPIVTQRPVRNFTPPPLPPSALTQNIERAAEKIPRLPRRLAWFIIILLLTVILSLCWFGRYRLAARFPALESFYLATGMIHLTALDTLDIQLKHAEKCLVSGRNMLCLSGHVTNRGDSAANVPPIYITALDASNQSFTDSEGRAILNWTVPAETVKLLPGESRAFSLTEPYPDKTITDFDYGFIDESP